MTNRDFYSEDVKKMLEYSTSRAILIAHISDVLDINVCDNDILLLLEKYRAWLKDATTNRKNERKYNNFDDIVREEILAD